MVFHDMLPQMILGMKWIFVVTQIACKRWFNNSFVRGPLVTFDAFLISRLIITFITIVSDASVLCSKGRLRRKKNRKKSGLLPNWGGGGVSDGSKMPNCYFGKVFFQLACRIILGPPKHVLHLV